MDEIETFGKKVLSETIAALKGEYAAIPQSVKDIMPKAALLIARGAVGGTLGSSELVELKHAMAIMGNVKVGGQIALNQLLLNTVTNVLAAGLGLLRKVIGL